jgi:hypothetical protein
VVFLILQAFPHAGLRISEVVAIPSILVLLPMGSLFMTIHTAEIKTSPSHRITITSPAPKSTPGMPELDPGLVPAKTVESFPLREMNSRTALNGSAVDRELAEIDEMEVEPVYGEADVDRVLSYRARKVKAILAAKAVTPKASKEIV